MTETSTLARRGPGARTRAVAALVCSVARCRRQQKLDTATLAVTCDGANARAVGSNKKELPGFDGAGSRAVASAACRNDVLRRIVQRLSVDMIRNYGATRIALHTRHPLDGCPAPMTGVRSQPNLGEQYRASFADQASCAGQWVAWGISHAARCCDFFAPGHVPARLRTKTPHQTGRPTVLMSAIGARLFHSTHYSE